jgi:ribonuclease J
MSKIKVFALGGLDEADKNMYVVQINEDLLILDCGCGYPSKPIPGVDFVVCNYDWLKERKSHIKGYILTHAHDDRILGMPYIYAECPAPVYTHKFTAKVLDFYTKQMGMNTKYNFVYVEKNGIINIGGIEVSVLFTTHSMPFSFGVSIHTDQGQILYPSDLVIDWSIVHPAFKMDFPSLLANKLDNVLLLMNDSTNADIKGHNSPNYRFAPKIEPYIHHQKSRIYISIYFQNAINLVEILEVCQKYNKTVIFSSKNVEKIVLPIIGEFNLLPGKLKTESIDNINRIRSQDTVVLIVGNRLHIFDEIIRIANGQIENKAITFDPQDLFIFACPAFFNNDIIRTKAVDEIYRTGMQVVQYSVKEVYTPHACEEDIKGMLSVFCPKYYMPVTGYYKSLLANAMIAIGRPQFNYSNVFVLDDGMVLEIEGGKAKVSSTEKVPCSNILIDGIDVGNIGNNVIEERGNLANDGVVVMGVTVSSKAKQVIGRPDVQMRGFVFLKESEKILHEITNIFNDQVNVYLTGFYNDPAIIEEKIVERVMRYIRKETGKNPIIIPKIIDLDK